MSSRKGYIKRCNEPGDASFLTTTTRQLPPVFFRFNHFPIKPSQNQPLAKMHATAFLSALMLGASGAAAAAIDQRAAMAFISVTFYNDVNRPNSTDPNQALTLTVSTGGTCSKLGQLSIY